MDRDTAEKCTILRGLVGSTVHGLNVNDGIEDRDEMGVCVETFDSAMTLAAPFEQFIYRSAAEREGRANARSTGGDLDLTIYSLRKWTRLALKGNPTILLLLFTPDDQLMFCDAMGAELRALTPAIVSRPGSSTGASGCSSLVILASVTPGLMPPLAPSVGVPALISTLASSTVDSGAWAEAEPLATRPSPEPTGRTTVRQVQRARSQSRARS